MAEILVSPGVLANENDQSFVTQQPVTLGAALIGPTVKGPVEDPVIVTTFSDYSSRFGTTLQSGSGTYTPLTTLAAQNYFSNGGTSLVVARTVPSASLWTFATASVLNSTVSDLLTTPDALLTSVTSNPTDAGANTYASVATTNTGAGTGAIATVIVAGTTAPTITSITLTNAGSGYIIGDVLTIAAGALGTGQLITAQNVLGISNGAAYALGAETGPETVAQSSTTGTGTGASFTITGDGTNVSALTVSSIGTGHVAADVITISAADLITAGFTGATGNLTITLGAGSTNVQDSTLATFTLAVDDFNQNTTAFTLESIDKGVEFNNSGSLLANDALGSGSIENIRYEIATASTSSGLFSLVIRRGDDTEVNKVVLETWPNLSLDETQPNYISAVIGDQERNYNSTENYIEISGSHPNNSRYVRIKSVATPTYNFFDNAGNARSQYTSSIPVVGSGSYGGVFDGAVGSNFQNQSALGANNYYNAINSTNTQGLVGKDYDNMISLLANQDDFSFNAMFTPGIYYDDYSSQVTTLINNTQVRGDNLYVLDLVAWGSTINNVVTEAGNLNSSYAAAYWPWVRIRDAFANKNVWVPASTMIGGVYAYNDRVSEPWFAPAGINRGGLATVIAAERKVSSTNRDTLYEANINPIATFPGTGVVVYGQKTLQRRASALDRVNVRRLLIALKSYISQIALGLVFDQNTIATRNNFLAAVNPYLESVQQRQGLYAFKVVMDSSNNTPDVIDRNQLIGQIYLQPTKTAEFIYLDFNILPTGATFPS